MADDEIEAIEALWAAAEAEDQLLAAHAAWLRQRDALEAQGRSRTKWFCRSRTANGTGGQRSPINARARRGESRPD